MTVTLENPTSKRIHCHRFLDHRFVFSIYVFLCFLVSGSSSLNQKIWVLDDLELQYIDNFLLNLPAVLCSMLQNLYLRGLSHVKRSLPLIFLWTVSSQCIANSAKRVYKLLEISLSVYPENSLTHGQVCLETTGSRIFANIKKAVEFKEFFSQISR